MKTLSAVFLLSFLAVGTVISQQQQTQLAFKSLDDGQFQFWSGLKPQDASKGGVTLDIPGEAIYRAQKGPQGAYSIGLKSMNDSTINLCEWYGLRFEIELDRDNAMFAADFTLSVPRREIARTFRTPPPHAS